MPTVTATQRLAEVLIGEPVVAWCATRRATGASLRAIATELRKATDDKVDVTAETIRAWLEEAEKAA